jgi:hypothetical protein
MADRPILFSGPMVRAILDGRKTQTRRVLRIPKGFRVGNLAEFNPEFFSGKPNDASSWGDNFADDGGPMTLSDVARWQFDIGDRLWVRETWSHTGDSVLEIRQARIAPTGRVIYAATPAPDAPHAKYWPSIFMPREFSRLTLTVIDVRVERLQDISSSDAKAEGADALADNPFGSERDALPSYRWGFAALWASINGASSWSANPWVTALTFAVAMTNIDTISDREAV